MQMHPAKRVEIIIEKVMQRRISGALDNAGVSGYTILPVRGGNGASGPWTREGGVSPSGGMVAVICVVAPERVEPLLEAAFEVVERHIGIVTVGDVEVIRPDRF